MKRLGLFLLGLALLCCLRFAQAVEVQFADASGKIVLSAEWFPVSSAGRHPVVIALHGCGGVRDAQGRFNPIVYREAAYYQGEEIHFLTLDSFSLRGISSICEVPLSRRPIDEERRREDVMAALSWLSTQPGVDMTRIAVLGRSHGAQTVLSLLNKNDRWMQEQLHRIKAGIALYPGCNKFLREPRYQIGAPLLLLVGEKDDWTPAQDCVRLVSRLRQEQPEVALEFHVYADSYHGFDALNPIRVRTDVATTKSGTATVGGNALAREQAHRHVFEFLSVHFSQTLLLSHEARYQLKPVQR